MAQQDGTATTQEDLIQQLFTFAVANGWTNDELDLVNNRASLSRGLVFVHFGWDGTESGGPNNISMTQSTAFSGAGTLNDAHTNDSGNGVGTTVLNTERRVSGIGNGPFTAYHFFHSNSPVPYIYIVLEFAAGIFRHFGFGEIAKIGDWVGGEWVGGHVWLEDGAADDNPIDTRHSILLDGQHQITTGDGPRVPATMRVLSVPNQNASDWSNVGTGSNSTWEGVDGGAAQRSTVVGGIRGGFLINQFAYLPVSLLNGFVPMIPCPIVREDRVPTDDEFRLLGYMADIRHVQMKFFEPGDSFSVGGDTWRIYPGVRKRFEQDNTQESRDMGIAYKVVP